MLVEFFTTAFLVMVPSCGTSNAINSERAINSTGICTIQVPLPDGKLTLMNVCCTGFQPKKNSVNFECETMCPNGCENGICKGLNICICQEGYFKGSNGKCIPNGSSGCLKGDCSKGRCCCPAGYVPDSEELYCVPLCPEGCGIGGRCIGPRVCGCDNGYQLNSKTKKCQPHCPGGCGPGGICTSPNVCTCQTGYTLGINKCKPYCPRGCKNGTCSAPNKCTCPQGFILNQAGNECTINRPSCQLV